MVTVYSYIINYIAGIPYDGIPEQNVVGINLVLTATMTVLAVAGATFAAACMMFNFINRKKKSVNSLLHILNFCTGIS